MKLVPGLGDRFKQLADEFGVYERDLAPVLGFKATGIASKWRKRAEQAQDPGYDSLLQVGNALWLSLDWLVDDDAEVRWSQRMLRARSRLLSLARQATHLAGEPKYKRLAAVWEWLRGLMQLQPDATRIWALYLHWQPCDWDACITGLLQPTAVQLAQAAWVTGLPERWFWDGDQTCLMDYPTELMEELGRYLQANNLWPDDVIRELESRKSSRV